ncbi:MAG: hypothetical protein ACR2QO_21900 [Acidimicrobiales bacterium]
MASPNPMDGAQEVQDLLVSYAKQETVEPLKTLGRYFGFGIAGSILVALGAFFVGLGVLRLTQSFSAFAGSSWASTLPYVIALVVLVLFLGLIYLALGRAKRKVA